MIIGLGNDLRFESNELVGTALVLGDSLIHLSASHARIRPRLPVIRS